MCLITSVNSFRSLLFPTVGENHSSDDDWNAASSGEEFDLDSDEDDAFDAMSSDGSVDVQSSPIRPKTHNDVMAAAGTQFLPPHTHPTLSPEATVA